MITWWNRKLSLPLRTRKTFKKVIRRTNEDALSHNSHCLIKWLHPRLRIELNRRLHRRRVEGRVQIRDEGGNINRRGRIGVKEHTTLEGVVHGQECVLLKDNQHLVIAMTMNTLY
jgi:hypothetical protein